jgi:predicted DCC family thiol-disulfide oxidoreductase YuxK
MTSPVLLFDGVCNLCNASVQWVLLHDRKGIFRFAALQSGTGQALLRKWNRSTDDFDSVVLADGDRLFLQSDVPLEIVRRLGGWWSLRARCAMPFMAGWPATATGGLAAGMHVCCPGPNGKGDLSEMRTVFSAF